MAGKLERIPKLLYKNIPTGRGRKTASFDQEEDRPARMKTERAIKWLIFCCYCCYLW